MGLKATWEQSPCTAQQGAGGRPAAMGCCKATVLPGCS